VTFNDYKLKKYGTLLIVGNCSFWSCYFKCQI